MASTSENDKEVEQKLEDTDSEPTKRLTQTSHHGELHDVSNESKQHTEHLVQERSNEPTAEPKQDASHVEETKPDVLVQTEPKQEVSRTEETKHEDPKEHERKETHDAKQEAGAHAEDDIPVFNQETVSGEPANREVIGQEKENSSSHNMVSSPSITFNIEDTRKTESPQSQWKLIPSLGSHVGPSVEDLSPFRDPASQQKSHDEIAARILHHGDFIPKTKKDLLDTDEIQYPKSRCHCTKTRIYRYVNLIRSVFTTIYGLTTVSLSWNAIDNSQFKARGYQIAVIIFLILDVLPTVFKCFPELLFCVPPHLFTRDFANPKRVSIWHLLADIDLIFDMLPVIANVILKIYAFRLGELQFTSSAPTLQLNHLSPDAVSKVFKTTQFNFSLLVIFCITLATTISFHTSRLMGILWDLKARTLALIILFKVLLMCFDLITNAFFLYTVLQSRGYDLFTMDLNANLTLSVVATSVITTSLTNVIANFPLHVAYNYFLISLHAPSANITWQTVFLSAFRKTFHPFILVIFGTYAFYCLAAMARVLTSLSKFDITNVPAGPRFSSAKDSLYGFLWLDVVINYGSAVLISVLFWTWFVFYYMLGGVLLWRRCRARCCPSRDAAKSAVSSSSPTSPSVGASTRRVTKQQNTQMAMDEVVLGQE